MRRFGTAVQWSWHQAATSDGGRLADECRLVEQRSDEDLFDVRAVGHDIEDRGHHFLEDAAKAARTILVLERQLRDLIECFRLDDKLDTFVAKDFLELAVDRVF